MGVEVGCHQYDVRLTLYLQGYGENIDKRKVTTFYLLSDAERKDFTTSHEKKNSTVQQAIFDILALPSTMALDIGINLLKEKKTQEAIPYLAKAINSSNIDVDGKHIISQITSCKTSTMAIILMMTLRKQLLNGAKEIEFGKHIWNVIKQDEYGYLLIAKDVVELREFSTSYEDIAWEKSSIRKYLNDEFLQSNFSEIERNLIATTTIYSSETASQYLEDRATTQDKIYLLSIDEVQNLYHNDLDRIATYKGKKTSWWLRSCCHTSYEYSRVSEVSSGGSILYYGYHIGTKNVVRPVLHIKPPEEWANS